MGEQQKPTAPVGNRPIKQVVGALEILLLDCEETISGLDEQLDAFSEPKKPEMPEPSQEPSGESQARLPVQPPTHRRLMMCQERMDGLLKRLVSFEERLNRTLGEFD